MSWLKLTAGNLYLMKRGSDQYIDRVKINQTSVTNQRIEGSISEFPHEWFESESQRPEKIVVNVDDERNGIPNLSPFTTLQLLKRFEVPVGYLLFEDLKTSTKISELIGKFEDTIGTRFSDEFFAFKNAGNSWKIISRIKFIEDFDIIRFPDNPINLDDHDNDEEEPSFISILLEVLWNSGYTIKSYLLNNPNEESKIDVELRLVKPKAFLSQQSVTSSTLERAIIPKEFTRKEENRKLSQVLRQLSDERKIAVNTPPDMEDRDAEFNFDGLLTFTEVMDTIASNHGAFWDWQGRESAFLRKTVSG